MPLEGINAKRAGNVTKMKTTPTNAVRLRQVRFGFAVDVKFGMNEKQMPKNAARMK